MVEKARIERFILGMKRPDKDVPAILQMGYALPPLRMGRSAAFHAITQRRRNHPSRRRLDRPFYRGFKRGAHGEHQVTLNGFLIVAYWPEGRLPSKNVRRL